MQSKARSAQESAANTVAGILLNQAVLWAFGVPLASATAITAIMIFISYARSYAVRRFFNALEAK